MTKLSDHKAVLYSIPFLPPLCWGLSIVVAKWAGTRIPPLNLSFMRFLVTLPLLLPLILYFHFQYKQKASQNSSIPSSSPFRLGQKGQPLEFGLLLLIGITGVALNNTIFYFGLNFTLASDSSLIAGISPILNGIFAYFFLKTPFRKNQIIGTIIGFAGVFLVIGFVAVGFGWERLIGDLIIICSVSVWSISFIASKKASDEGISSLAIAHHSMLLGVLLMLPIVVLFGGIFDTISLILNDPELILAFIFFGVGAGALAYSLWYAIIHKLGPVQTAIYLNSLPFWAVFFSALLLQESLTVFHLLGLITIALGVIIVNKPNSQTNSSKTSELS